MTSLDLPLFGDPEPVQRPSKTALGYLAWLNDLNLDGWRFWAHWAHAASYPRGGNVCRACVAHLVVA